MMMYLVAFDHSDKVLSFVQLARRPAPKNEVSAESPVVRRYYVRAMDRAGVKRFAIEDTTRESLIARKATDEELKCSACMRAIPACVQSPCVFRDLLAKGKSNGS